VLGERLRFAPPEAFGQWKSFGRVVEFLERFHPARLLDTPDPILVAFLEISREQFSDDKLAALDTETAEWQCSLAAAQQREIDLGLALGAAQVALERAEPDAKPAARRRIEEVTAELARAREEKAALRGKPEADVRAALGELRARGNGDGEPAAV
jgi:hypothetical protein